MVRQGCGDKRAHRQGLDHEDGVRPSGERIDLKQLERNGQPHRNESLNRRPKLGRRQSRRDLLRLRVLRQRNRDGNKRVRELEGRVGFRRGLPNADADAHPDTNAHPDTDTDADTHADTHPDADTHPNPNPNPNRQRGADSHVPR